MKLGGTVKLYPGPRNKRGTKVGAPKNSPVPLSLALPKTVAFSGKVSKEIPNTGRIAARWAPKV